MSTPMHPTTARLVGRGRRGRQSCTVYEALTVLACARCSRPIDAGEHFTLERQRSWGAPSRPLCRACAPFDAPSPRSA
jgi:hypothetical protein